MVKTQLIYKGTEPNHLCCESILRQMPNKEWVAFIQSGGYTEPHIDNDVYLSRSTDRGATWGALEQVFEIPGKATYQTEVMVYNGEVTMFVTTHNGKFLDWQHWSCVSKDSGYTWGEFIPIPHIPDRTFIRNLFIKKNGDLVLPFQHYHIKDEELSRLKQEDLFIMRSNKIKPENGVLISSDHGKTWDYHGGIKIDVDNWIWAENNVVELSNGDMVMLIRADKTGFLYRSDSMDGGKTWSEAYPTDIPNPGNKVRILKLRDGRIALIHTPSSPSATKWMEARNPLSLWISNDDMKSWYHKQDLITFPGSLSYPDGFVDEEEGYIHFAFEYNRHDSIYVGVKIDSV
jgi:predicted neuraminidase